MEKIIKKQGKEILLGNEAIIRGALESGVQFVSTYPGTPASEIGNEFYKIKNQKSKIKNNFYFEFSVNEKIALEAGIGASFSGRKVLVAMKNFGLNVASDSLLPLCYTGSNGSMVIIVADDPSCHSSAQSEENSRAFGALAHIPILEPSDPQECKDFTKLAFQISEKYKIPVMLRITTRVAHQQMPVQLNSFPKKTYADWVNAGFVKNQNRYVTMPPRVLEMKKELLEKIEKIRKEISEKNEINSTFGSRASSDKLGIIASGVSYLYVREALEELKISLPVLKIGMFYPLPEEKIRKFIKSLKKVLVIEELEPYLEKETERLAKNSNCKLQIFGKKDGIPETGEIKPEHVLSVLAKLTGKKISNKFQVSGFKFQGIKHFPRFCSGCPYWKVFAAVKKANFKGVVFGGDIGCYMMAAFPPHQLYDFMSCMSSSIGIGHGIKKSVKNKVISFIGDSTFFHSGIASLANAVYNQSEILLIILDNSITAMTGHQPNPGAPLGNGTAIKIENVVRSLGVKNLKITDPGKNYQDFIKTVKDFLKKKEVSVIIARHPCWLYYGKK